MAKISKSEGHQVPKINYFGLLIAGLKHTETDIEEIKRDWMFMLKLTLLLMKTLSLL